MMILMRLLVLFLFADIFLFSKSILSKGVTVLTQLIVLPTIKLYWSSNHEYGQETVKCVFPRKRYTDILRFLHVSDNNVPQNDRLSADFDKLAKIRELVYMINYNFRQASIEGRFKSIDESMTRFKGRSSLKQYNPDKPIKRGFEVINKTKSIMKLCL